MRVSRREVLAMAGSAVLIAPARAPSAPASLLAPFDVAACRDARGRPVVPTAFGNPPAPVLKLDLISKYKPGTGSNEIDPKTDAIYKARLKQVQDYTRGLTDIADAYAAAKTPNLATAKAGLAWLQSWCSAGALLDAPTEQGRSVLCWELIPIVWSWWKLKPAGIASDAAAAAIDSWIGQMRDIVRGNYSENLDANSRNNNHSYWAGWSVMSAACLLQDQSGFEWSADIFDRAMTQITDDGDLPLEMARGARALHYHNFSLSPLTMMAETLRANGRGNAFADKSGPYRRLAKRTLSGFASPKSFEVETGKTQITAEALTSSQMAWLEPYFARTSDDKAVPFVTAYRPMVSPRMGGDLTYYFARA